MVENWTQETASAYLESLPTEWILDTVNATESGHCDPLKAYINLYRLNKVVSEAMEQIKHMALNEADKYPKTFQFAGAEIQQKSTPGRFVFTRLPEWNEQKFKLKQIEDKYKQAWAAREKNLHTVTDDGEIIDLSELEYVPGGQTIAIKLL